MDKHIQRSSGVYLREETYFTAIVRTTMWLSLGLPFVVYAATTPSVIVYEGRLLDSSSNAITTIHDFRFSFWKSADHVSSDTSGTGAVNTAADNYGGWSEEQSITPDSNGYFTVELGSSTTLPTIDFDSHKFLQVELKTNGADDTSYQIIDPNSSSNTIDRMTIGSLMYAEDAEMVDGRTITTASGGIVIYGAGVSLSGATIHAENTLTSSGTISAAGDLTINSDNGAADAILTFGNDVAAETLRFSDITNGFIFSDDVEVQGTLSGNTLTGFNLSDCDTATTSKLLWDTTSQTFSCGTDTDTDTDTHFSGTGALQTAFDARYINQSGDTVTGALVIANEGSEPSLNVRGTASGQIIHAQDSLTSSGALSVDGTSALQGNTTVTGTLDTIGNITTDANLTINEDNGIADAILTFGNDIAAETLIFSDTTNGFIFSDDLEVQGTMSGITLRILTGAIIENGNVGIGTTNPEAKLQVTGGGLCVGSDANCNTDNDTEGIVYSSSISMIAYDLAEMYPTKDASISAGEIISLDLSNGVFVQRAEINDKKLIGVVSTDPGALLGGFAGNQFTGEHQVAVALAGRVPVHVSTENGIIEVGDYLTISSIPGVARKANEGEQAIGYALQPYSAPEVGDIQVFVQLERASSDAATATFDVNGSTTEIIEGTIDITTNFHLLSTEDRAEEDVLVVINGGRPQQILVLKKLSDTATALNTGDQTITVRRSGKLLIKKDFVFDDADDALVLMYISDGVWVELSRTGNNNWAHGNIFSGKSIFKLRRNKHKNTLHSLEFFSSGSVRDLDKDR